jgi:hypothetical protein
MDSVSLQITSVIHIPLRPVCIGIQAVPDVPGGNLLVSAEPSIPSAEICDTDYRLGHLNVQVHAFVFEIVMIEIIHQFVSFAVCQFGVICFKVILPIIVIQVDVTPNDVSFVIRSSYRRILLPDVLVYA